MARIRNTVETKVLKLSLTQEAKEYLRQLVSIGVYGKTPTEVAHGLVMRGLQELLKDGTITPSRNSPT